MNLSFLSRLACLPFLSSVFCVLVVMAGLGCSKPARGLQMIAVPVTGNSFVSTFKHHLVKDSVKGGLSNLGDVNGDGFDDVLLTSPSSHDESSPRTPAGWMEAICGKSGESLWKRLGTHDKGGADNDFGGYFSFDSAFAVNDLDDDKIADIYALADSKNRIAWISGKTGKIIHVGHLEKVNYILQRPAVIHQAGTKREVLFLQDEPSVDLPFSLQAFSVPELKPQPSRKFSLASAPKSSLGALVLTTSLPDENDGVPDWLIQTDVHQPEAEKTERMWDWRIVCGRTFKELRSVRTKQPKIGGETQHALLKHGAAPNEYAMIVSSNTGSGPDGRLSSLQAVSLKDSSILWSKSGNEIDGGADSFLIEKNAKMTGLGKDVKFGSPVVVIEDLNGDQVGEVATTIQLSSIPGFSVALFSGKDGALMRIVNMRSHNLSDDLLALRSGERIRLAAIGRNLANQKLELMFFLT